MATTRRATAHWEGSLLNGAAASPLTRHWSEHGSTQMDDERVDRELGLAFGDLVAAVRGMKQVVWTTPRGPLHDAVDALFQFLVAQTVAVADAEAAIGGRSPNLVSPSARETRNVIADAGGSNEAVLEMVDERGRDLANDMRERAAKVEGSDAAKLFTGIADGLAEHLDALRAAAD
jgi:hypothetical protein